MNNTPAYHNSNYDLSDFDEKMNLKFGANNIILTIFLLSPLFLIALQSSLKGYSAISLLEASYRTKDILLLSLVGIIPIIIHLIGQLFHTKSNILVKFAINHGASLFISSALFSMFLWLYIVLNTLNNSSIIQISFFTLSIYALLYAFKSKRLKDFFISKKVQDTQFF